MSIDFIRQRLEAMIQQRLDAARDAAQALDESVEERVEVTERIVVRDIDVSLIARVLKDLLRWDRIAGKPKAYPPEAHSHTWEELHDKPATYPPEQHSHTWAAITGKPKAYPPAEHTHPLPEELRELLAVLQAGRPGQVLVKTRDGVEWRDVAAPQVVYVGGGGVTPTPPTPAGIVDSAGAFLVDSAGNYVEAA